MSLAIALITLPFWCLFAVCLFFDLYLPHHLLGEILKPIFPIAVLANIAGVIVGVVSAARNKGSRILAVAGIVLNAMPILTIGCFVFWFVFLFKI